MLIGVKPIVSNVSESTLRMEAIQNAHLATVNELEQKILVLSRENQELNIERDSLQEQMVKLSDELEQVHSTRAIGKWFGLPNQRRTETDR